VARLPAASERGEQRGEQRHDDDVSTTHTHTHTRRDTDGRRGTLSHTKPGRGRKLGREAARAVEGGAGVGDERVVRCLRETETREGEMRWPMSAHSTNADL
jgi:hypothetical protein